VIIILNIIYNNLWHGNPKLYNSDDINPVNKKKYGDLYNKTVEREKIIKENGYNLITIWEDEYLKNNVKL